MVHGIDAYWIFVFVDRTAKQIASWLRQDIIQDGLTLVEPIFGLERQCKACVNDFDRTYQRHGQRQRDLFRVQRSLVDNVEVIALVIAESTTGCPGKGEHRRDSYSMYFSSSFVTTFTLSMI